MITMLRRLLRFLLPVLLLAGCAYLGWWFYSTKPEPKVEQIPAPLVRVEGQTLKKAVFPVVARSQGVVQPLQRTVLTSEVAGKIVTMSPHFRPGHFVTENEVLASIDPVNFETALTEARAALAAAAALLVDEKSRVEQAVEGWRALGRQGTPGPLLTRAHQIAKADADVAAAQAQVRRAERDLERTELRAPYAGQVLRQEVDLGQVVNAGADIGELFGIEAVEVRLPLPEREMAHLQLPQLHPGEEHETVGAEVRLLAREGAKSGLWPGRLVRVEGAVDAGTRQTIAVARVEQPFAKREDGAPPLKIGQFVEAEILGVSLEDVLVLPRKAVRAGNEIILITKENRLRRVIVEPLAGDARNLAISALAEDGPRDGDVLCVTPIPFPVEGARVLPTIDGQTERPGMVGAEAGQTGAKGSRVIGAPRES